MEYTYLAVLLEAVRNKNLAVVKFLLEIRADPIPSYTTIPFFGYPVYIAAMEGFTDVIGELLDAGAYVEFEDYRHPVYYAAQNGHADTVKRILEWSQEGGRYDISVKEAMCGAVDENRGDIAEWVVPVAAGVMDKMDFEFWGERAIRVAGVEVVRAFLDAGMEVGEEHLVAALRRGGDCEGDVVESIVRGAAGEDVLVRV